MKLYHKKYLFFSLLFIIIFPKTNQNEEKKLERIKNAIKFIIYSINDKIADITFFLFEHKKYNLVLDNLKLLRILEKDMEIIKESNANTNEIYYKIKNLPLHFISDLNIVSLYNTIKDKPFFIECNFIEIKFKLIDDFNIEFVSSEIDNVYFSNGKKISKLEYFKEFNNKQNNSISHEINDSFHFNLQYTINKIFVEKIKEVEKTINLLTYDMFYLFNNSSEIIDILSVGLLCDSLQIVKIINKNSFINLNRTENSIKLNKLEIKGIYYIVDLALDFKISCSNEKNRIIFLYNKQNQNKYFDINLELKLDECEFIQDYRSYYDDEISFTDAINSIYLDLLNENAKYYYNNIFN